MKNEEERKTRSSAYLGATLSTCPHCLRLVKTKIVTEDGHVYFNKYCPNHGHSQALISEDVEYYLESKKYSRPGTIPHFFSSNVEKGCPEDCGLCPDHEQHTCHPIVEITDCCELKCPICMVDNKDRGFISIESFRNIIKTLIKAEGKLENITLSGGEPSLHPRLWDLTSIADRPEISRISLVTNGLRIAQDHDFCKKLKNKNIYVILQWDGFDDHIYYSLRGQPLMDIKTKALANLEEHDIPAQLIFVAARGVNEDQIGQVVRLMIDKSNILSLVIQPLVFPAGLRDDSRQKDHEFCNYDPLDRITIPGVLDAFEMQTQSLLNKEDFFPLPCPNPECVSLTYLLRLNNGEYIPFPRFVNMERYLHLLSQSATLEPNKDTEDALHEIINELWTSAGAIPDSEAINEALRRAVTEIFSNKKGSQRELSRISERQAKSIFIHHYMDPYNFDLSRVVKCCHHYPRIDGRLMPICAFNLFHRKKEANPFVA